MGFLIRNSGNQEGAGLRVAWGGRVPRRFGDDHRWAGAGEIGNSGAVLTRRRGVRGGARNFGLAIGAFGLGAGCWGTRPRGQSSRFQVPSSKWGMVEFVRFRGGKPVLPGIARFDFFGNVK